MRCAAPRMTRGRPTQRCSHGAGRVHSVGVESCVAARHAQRKPARMQPADISNYLVTFYLIFVVLLPVHIHCFRPHNVTASAHPLHHCIASGYPLHRSPHAVPVHIHHTVSRTLRTNCTIALTTAAIRRRDRGTMRCSKTCTAQTDRTQTIEEGFLPHCRCTCQPFLARHFMVRQSRVP